MSVSPSPGAGKRLLLGISGGIAAYKAVDLARKLTQAGWQVQCVLTEGGAQFVSPLALQAVTGFAVRQSLWDAQAEAAMGHIELARWADVLLVAPASADVLARLAAGMANDLLTTLVLAARAPLLVAPAMNGYMWRHAATQANVALLRSRGVQVLGPDVGALACGDEDVGRMISPEELVAAVQDRMSPAMGGAVLAGRRVLITAGPTHEDLDPVRFIGNRSSGKMGYALAQVAAQLGAQVTLVSGPVSLTAPAGVQLVQVRSAQQMFEAVQQHFIGCDVMVAAAAVADYRPAQPAAHKLKKQGDAGLTLTLVQNPDIVAWAAAQPGRGRVVAFAAETDNLLDNARAKLTRKGVDGVLANSVAAGAGFEQDDNHLFWVTAQQCTDLGHDDKTALARRVWQQLQADFWPDACATCA